MRKVFTDKLPKWGEGISKGGVNWKETEGAIVEFVYDNIKGNIKIVDYDKESESLNIKYNNKHFTINTYSFLTAKLAKVLGKVTGEYKVEVGERFKDDKRDLIIIDREYRIKPSKNKNIRYKFYKYKCNICGYDEGWISESHLISDRGCGCCKGNIIVEHINSLYKTDPWVMDIGVSEEDAKTNSRGTHKRVIVKCPDCGQKKEMMINNIIKRKSIKCPCNSAGYSYPEKIVSKMLKELNIEHKLQLTRKTFEWCDKYRYDFYFKYNNETYIIETHGKQHYEEISTFTMSLEENKKVDKIKKELAKSNNIDNYIVIDCRESNLEYIKNNILNSELNKKIDLSNVNWRECEKYALSNKIKEVCIEWENKKESSSVLAKRFDVTKGTIVEYLKKGAELGWCNYIPKNAGIKSRKESEGYKKCIANKQRKVEVFKNGISLGIFESVKSLSEDSEKLFGVKLLRSNISSVCVGIRNHHKGYTFKYVY